MASVYSATTEAEEALGAATAETVIALHSTAVCKPRIIEWGVTFDGTSATAEPVVAGAAPKAAGSPVVIQPTAPQGNQIAVLAAAISATAAAVSVLAALFVLKFAG